MIFALLFKYDPNVLDDNVMVKEVLKNHGGNTSIDLSKSKIHSFFKGLNKFTYIGSATTPSCQENVLWIVSEIVKINRSQ
mmetsp:Transcript_73844/g.159725  ORF Transcript_73844/g.159725 Transcript_73844/m.159725 type:complete len:80 (+) Transcript_73844:530-769(+)